jgi:ankyrin repeat protein
MLLTCKNKTFNRAAQVYARAGECKPYCPIRPKVRPRGPVAQALAAPANHFVLNLRRRPAEITTLMDANQRLEEAVRAGDLRRLRHALARGATVNHQTLHEAARRGDVQILQALLAAPGRRMLDRLDSDGFTPLMRAVEAGHLPAVRLLLDAGADPNASLSAPIRETALRIAAAQGTLEMAQALLAAGADPLVPGRMMLTALDRARERRTPDGRRITALILRTLEQRTAPPRRQLPSRPKRRKRMASRPR